MKRWLAFSTLLLLNLGLTITGCPGDGPDDQDGVEDAADRFFVDRAGGDDANTGRRAAPLATIQEGIDRAAVSGGSVYVAGGVYEERVLLASDVELRAGYDPTNWTVDRANFPTTVMDEDVPFVGHNVTSALVEGFTAVTADGVPATSNFETDSKFGVALIGCADVTLHAMMLLPGNGGDGMPGVDGADGKDGAPGAAGANAGACGGFLDGGAGGQTVVGLPVRGGNGGSGNVGGGTGGQNGTNGGLSGIAQPGFGGRGGELGQPGLDGTVGGAGITGGSFGEGGESVGAFTTMTVAGTVAKGGRDHAVPVYVGARGSDGGTGVAGGPGGGGGGGGGGVVFACGGSGGGGGGYAQGGLGGDGGGGGAASVGVFLSNSTGITISDCVIQTGNGGAGAPATEGGRGGFRGAGGAGGAGFGGQGAGGDGGDGGGGASGGAGGGGGGGPVIGIAHGPTSEPTRNNNTFVLGMPGAGGIFRSNPNSNFILIGEDGMAANLYEFLEL